MNGIGTKLSLENEKFLSLSLSGIQSNWRVTIENHVGRFINNHLHSSLFQTNKKPFAKKRNKQTFLIHTIANFPPTSSQKVLNRLAHCSFTTFKTALTARNKMINLNRCNSFTFGTNNQTEFWPHNAKQSYLTHEIFPVKWNAIIGGWQNRTS